MLVIVQIDELIIKFKWKFKDPRSPEAMLKKTSRCTVPYSIIYFKVVVACHDLGIKVRYTTKDTEPRKSSHL